MTDQLLNQHITDMECLNEHSDFTVQNLFQNSDSVLKSDVDQQLMIKVQFRNPVKISGFRFYGCDAESIPTEVKVFTNRPNIGFGEADDTPATQDLCLDVTQCNIGAKKDCIVPVKFVKFQNVNDLQIFVSENGGADVTCLKYLEIFGTMGESSNIADWKPVKG